MRDPCEAIWPLLSEMLDDELPAGERVTVLQHLEGCAVCRERLGEYEEIGRRVALPVPGRSQSLLGAFRLRLASELSHSPVEDWTAVAETQESPYDGLA